MMDDSPGAGLCDSEFSSRSRDKRPKMDPQSTSGSGTSMAKSKYFKMWSEQISSSGKRYYYNRQTEVSQWEKPSEWKEYERSLSTQQRPQSVSKQPQPPTPSSTRGVVDTPSPSMTSSPLVRMDHQKLAPSFTSQLSYGDQRGVKRHNVDSSALSTVTGGDHPTSNLLQSGYPADKYRRESSSIQRTSDQTQLVSAVNSRANAHDTTSSGKFGSTSTPRTPYAGCSTPFYTPISGYNQPSQSTPRAPQIPGMLGDENKYLRFYRPDTTTFRRGWVADHYSVEAKKLAEKRRVQDAAISAIDEDIISVQSLLKTAESKSAILATKLQMMGQRIAALEGKSL